MAMEGDNEMMERGARVIRELFDVDVRDRCRVRKVADIRAVFCYRMRVSGLSLVDIGKFLGINHSTVHHNYKKVADAFEYPLMYQDIIEMYARFNSVEL